jgi:hypothetical protein
MAVNQTRMSQEQQEGQVTMISLVATQPRMSQKQQEGKTSMIPQEAAQLLIGQEQQEEKAALVPQMINQPRMGVDDSKLNRSQSMNFDQLKTMQFPDTCTEWKRFPDTCTESFSFPETKDFMCLYTRIREPRESVDFLVERSSSLREKKS